MSLFALISGEDADFTVNNRKYQNADHYSDLTWIQPSMRFSLRIKSQLCANTFERTDLG